MARPLGRIVLATNGSLGDLNPYIAVARALIARGHEAVIATAPDYRPLVEPWARFAPLGPGFARFREEPALFQKVLREETAQGAARLLQDVLLPDFGGACAQLAAAAEGAALIVSHPLTTPVAARVAEERRLPWAAVALSPFVLSSLEPSPHLNLGLFDALLAEPEEGEPSGLRVCGAPLHEGTCSPRDLSELSAFLDAGEPPLVFALGSAAAWAWGEFWRAAFAASRALGRRALLITGPGTRVREKLPPEVRTFGYLPYSMVFPRAAAIVHQAGIGTLAQALRSGRPQLVVPFFADQPDTARRAAALGLARLLPLKTLGADSLTRELSILLDGTAKDRERAERVARDLRAVNGAERAADALLSLCR